MFTHLMSGRHRQHFVEHLYKNRQWPFHDIELSQRKLLEIAKEHAENKANLGEKIKTRKSDEVFLERNSFSLKDKISRLTRPGLQAGLLGPWKGAALVTFPMAQRRTMASLTLEASRGTILITSACPILIH